MAHFSNHSNFNKIDKIPEYAKNYRKELMIFSLITIFVIRIYGLKIIKLKFGMFEYCIGEDLAKKIKEAKETNNLKKERILKGFSRLYSICLNIYKIMDDYEDCEEFDEIRTFFSYIAQIFCNTIEKYIDKKKIAIKRIEKVLDCLVYDYAFCGEGWDEKGNRSLYLEKCDFKDGEDYEFLDIPVPITKTDEWYDNLKSINNR